MSAGKLVLFLGLAAMLVCPAVAKADISDYFDLTGGLNNVDFENREVIIRGTQGNWSVINPILTPVAMGDMVVSVFRAQQLKLSGSNIVWTAGTDTLGTTQYFSGYGVQEVGFASPSFLQYKTPTWDPFAGTSTLNIAAGETLRLFETASDWQVDNLPGANQAAQLVNSVASVVAANPYAAFTLLNGGYAQATLDPLFGVGAAYAGANNVAIPLSGAAIDGVQFQAYSPSLAPPTDISALATIQPNSTGSLMSVSPTSPWDFETYGPMMFKAVPEPGTLALWGGFLAIGAVVALRRRKR